MRTRAVRSTGERTSRASSSTSRARTSTRRRSRPPRSSRPAGARRACRSTRSSLRPCPTSARSPARSRMLEPTASPSSTRSADSRSTRGCARCSARRPAGTRGLRSSRSRSRPCTRLFAPPSCRSSAWEGVSTGRDALELIGAGASAVALGTVLFSDPDAPRRVREELDAELALLGYASPEEARGVAHPAAATPNA